MKSSSFDLEELNCWNKNLDASLDAKKPVCWQNSVAIFENSYLPHMISFLGAIWSVDKSLSQESKKIEFASIGLLQLQILNFEWPKVNIGRMRDLTLQDVISMIFLFLFFLH